MAGRGVLSGDDLSSRAAAVRFDRFDVEAGSARMWTGPWVEPGFPLVELVASWNVTLPAGSVIEIEAQVRRGGAESAWYSLGRWAHGAGEIGRTSVPGQHDLDAAVLVDRVAVSGEPAEAYRVRSTVGDATGVMKVGLLGAMAAGKAATYGGTPSVSLEAAVELDVPALSQQVHRGEYPELDGGGAAWCAPTSTAMVLAYWGAGPTATELAEFDPAYPDPIVAHAARHVFDPAYGGAGNWSFNVAYAGSFGLEAFVTRLRSLREAELFLKAGIPIVMSVAADAGVLRGFPLPGGTGGHLLVLVGVTGAGDAIVNDPAAATNDEVRRVYSRDELEQAWLSGPGGVAFVIHPYDTPLPDSPGNW